MADSNLELLPVTAGTVISGAATALIAGAGAPVVVAAGVLATAPIAIEALQKYWTNRQQRRLEEFWEKFVHTYQQLGFDAAALEIDATADESGAQESIIEAFRRVSDAYNDAAVAPLALLTAEYAAIDRRPDRFFRGFGAILSDITIEEYADFRRMLEETSKVGIPASWFELHESFEDNVACLLVCLKIDGQKKSLKLGQYTHLKTIFALLKQNGLGLENASGYVGSVSGPHVVVLKMEIVRRMQKYCVK